MWISHSVLIHDMESHVYILKKSMYGLKQAYSTWYRRIDGFPSNLGFTKSKVDSNLTTRLKMAT